MLKPNKGKLIVSSLIILLPVLVGVILWNDLPMQMMTHWGFDGVVDGWSGRPFAVFGLPLFLLVMHWFCIWITARDNRKKNQSNKVFSMVLWIMPVTSLFTSGIMYMAAFGRTLHLEMLLFLFMGLLFIVIGNYLPKTRQNRTIGIKIKWTLENEENWNATHRVGGRLWVIGGVLFLFCGFLPVAVMQWAMILGIIVLTAVPIAYSYAYHRKQVKAGTAVLTPIAASKTEKIAARISLVIAIIIMIGCGVLCFTGDIDVAYGEAAFTIEADYYDDLTVEYDIIDSIEYREDFSKGSRTFGFGSPRLLMGSFQNEEFGAYTLYAYKKCDAAVVLTAGDKVLAVNGQDAESTRVIYEELKNR
ncbi:MAG: SdpI family protein [Butyricicoccus sp.]|nr:SdpI family protein [Butyricicoccus sp.]MBQ8585508.1 SdpI family protein [Butyricicoccus sp.]